jgi:hypothetical protein
VLSNAEFVTLQGSGPVASTEYIVPVTSGQVRPIAAPVIGLAQTFQIIIEEGISVIAVFDKIAKLLADQRSIVTGPAANTAIGPIKLNKENIIIIIFFLIFFIYLYISDKYTN